ncbi:MAG TPA: hypothetical protein VGA69_09140 [Nitriliruptorales bacterium]
MTKTNFFRRGMTAAVAAVSAAAIAAPGATAAAGAPDVFAATGEALALELSVKTPDGLLSATPVGTDHVLQKISFTSAALNSDGVASAVANLIDGTLGTVGVSSGSGETSGEASFASQDLHAIQIGAGTTSYVADAAQNLSKSFSELAYIKASIAPLFDGSLGVPTEVTDPVQGAVQEVTAVVNGLVGDLNATIDEVEGAIQDAIGETINLPDVNLPAVPDVTSVDLLEIRKIWSSSLLDTLDGKVRSTVEAGIVEASLLGGLVEVPAFQYKSWAEAGGVPGSANAGTEVTTIAVRIAGSDLVKVSGDQITIGDTVVDLSDLNVTGTEADTILATLIDELTSLLNALGVSFAQGEGVTEVAPDGTSASAATSAFSLRVAPLHAVGAADALDVQLKLLPTKAAASAGVAPAPAPAPDAPPALPRTGGGAVAMVLGALAMGGAELLRRRF